MMQTRYVMDPYCYPQTTSSRYPSSSSSGPKKVVSIPIYFVGSDKPRSNSEPESALKIQKTFRGFRVRQNVKKIMAVRREVDEVEKKLEQRETMEFIKRNAKEKLKFNESLMALLLKLDSVLGVDDGVRDFRKAVIRKAIMLQEKIDSFVATIDDDADGSKKIDDSTADDVVNEGETLAAIDNDNDFNRIPDASADYAGNEGQIRAAMDDDDADYSKLAYNTTDGTIHDGEVLATVDVDAGDSDKYADKMSDRAGIEGDLQAENSNLQPENTDTDNSKCVEEREEMELKPVANEEENPTKRANDDGFVVVEKKEVRKRSKERLLEKMVEDNKKLMAMVADLCKKNATQASLLCSLSQRVEQLEKAMNDRAMRKKKKKNATLNAFVHHL